MKKIGIGITSYNRPDALKNCLDHIKKYSPKSFKIVVVDDASQTPLKEATFRFNKNVGISAAKNKCFELLEDCDHIFLFDDDCYPIVKDWYKPYIESGEAHLAYHFAEFTNGQKIHDSIELYRDNKVVAWTHQRGCMLYYTKEVLKVVGGMDWRFLKWGYEHANLADRIYNAGLTSFRYMDVVGSKGLFYSHDENNYNIGSSCTNNEKSKYAKINEKLYFENRNSKAYIDYSVNNKNIEGENVIITGYFTSSVDPQRGKAWEANINDLQKLIKSIDGKYRLIVINDCFDDIEIPNVTFVKVTPLKRSPYWFKWLYARKWLVENKHINSAWIVDATDVEMKNDPFPEMQPMAFYTGDENELLCCSWMLRHHPAPFLQRFMRGNPAMPLLNSGLCGGTRAMLLDFLGIYLGIYEDNLKEVTFSNGVSVGDLEMGLFNYVARTHFAGALSYGRHVNTIFKRFNEGATKAWWKHK